MWRHLLGSRIEEEKTTTSMMSKKRCRSGAQLAKVLVAFGDALGVNRNELLRALTEAQDNTGLALNKPTLRTLQTLLNETQFFQRPRSHLTLSLVLGFLDWQEHFQFLSVAKQVREIVRSSPFFLNMTGLWFSTLKPSHPFEISSLFRLRPQLHNVKFLKLNIGYRQLAVARALFGVVGQSIVKLDFNISKSAGTNYGSNGVVTLTNGGAAPALEAPTASFFATYFPGVDTSYDHPINLREMCPLLQELSGFRNRPQREDLSQLPIGLVKLTWYPHYPAANQHFLKFRSSVTYTGELGSGEANTNPAEDLNFNLFDRLKVLVLKQPTFGHVRIHSTSLEVVDMVSANNGKLTRTSFAPSCTSIREIFSSTSYGRSIYPSSDQLSRINISDCDFSGIAGHQVAFIDNPNVPPQCIVRFCGDSSGGVLEQLGAVSVANGNESGTPSAYLEHLKDLRFYSETTTPNAHLQILKERFKTSRYGMLCDSISVASCWPREVIPAHWSQSYDDY